MTYHLLLSRPAKAVDPTGPWSIEFGDFDRETVRQEMSDARNSNRYDEPTMKRAYRMLTVPSAGQLACELAVKELNRNEQRS